jgi:lysozyme family protein
MTVATYDVAMVRVFADEGGYTNDPVDPGGATNFGITIIDARKYWKSNATPADVKAMPKAVASDIYRKHYANPMRYDELPAGLDYSILDAAINSGVGRAPVWAGKALGIAAKSINDVVAPANAANDKVSAIQKYWAVRLAFLHGLKTWGHFGGGWGRRCAQGEAAAVKMWLSIGAALAPAAVQVKLQAEGAKASTKSKQAATAGATTGTASASPAAPANPVTPSIDVAGMSLGGKIALGILIAAGIALTVYFIRKAIIHNQRADAYANA